MFTSKENYINWANDRDSIKLRTSEMQINGCLMHRQVGQSSVIKMPVFKQV